MDLNIAAKLESSRKELLDLSMRNNLLNYKASRAKGLHIIQERSSYVFDILVKQNKSMTFLGTAIDNNEDETPVIELPPLSADELDEVHADTKLQTSESDKKLQTKILNTYYFARTSIEEQGVNTLYLSLGMLHWFESGNEKEVRKAPLLLIPVILERSSANERFRLRYSGSELGANISLQAKLLTEFNIAIPNLPEFEDINIEDYFKEIRVRIQKEKTWSVEPDGIELGFFSFGKFIIYNDLDVTQWPDNNHPGRHVLMQSLFGDGFKELPPTATEEHHIDRDTVAANLIQVVDADSSQLLAMLAVHEGRNMVIQGPPGTGKSQTITNIIANAVGQGKKVLFVAEKMAALEVVKRRMDNIHLGEACLELHSHKANKKELHEELKRVLELGKPAITQLESEVRLLEAHKENLNAYSDAANTIILKSNLSPQQIMGYLLEIDQHPGKNSIRKINISNVENWDTNRMSQAAYSADTIEARLKDIGVPNKLLFYGTTLTVFHPHERAIFQEAFNKSLTATHTLINYLEALASELSVEVPQKKPSLDRFTAVWEFIEKSPDLSGLAIQEREWVLQHEDIRELLLAGKEQADLSKAYEETFLPEAWDLDVLPVRQCIQEHGHKWYKFLIGDYKKNVRKLAAVCKSELPDSADEKIKLIDVILMNRRLLKTVAESEGLAKQLFGRKWSKQRSDWEMLIQANNYLYEVHKGISEDQLPSATLSYLEKNTNKDIEKKGHTAEIIRLYNNHKEAFEKIKSLLKFDNTLAERNIESYSFEDQHKLIQEWSDQLDTIHQSIAWNLLVENAAQHGFEFLTMAALDWPDASKLLKIALYKAWYEYLIEHAMTTLDPLKRFERTSHEEIIAKFQDLDEKNFQYNRIRAALSHYQSVPRHNGGGQLNILKAEFNKRSRHLPIRRLIQEAGLAIQAIKPVMMMSPLSIANFLPPGSITFDLVIFDEASQVRPVEALGAIMRGAQLVVVGDTRQLPPTSFFDKLNAEVGEEEENETADMQSILGMCNGKGMPEKMLRWHYRSRHESLISLSNNEFYENKLVIFPSPGSRKRIGLAFHYLPDAVYDRGKTRTNPIEAAKVAEAVINHARQFPKESLGVAAFSTAQMQAIQQELEVRRRQHPELENFFISHPNEPFFIKNLENVQGDERDVIFISIGYGKLQDGNVNMSFGPINNEGGERRLNVLITRAKYRCEVFANIRSEDIKTTASSRFGVRVLKSFLHFAEHGKSERADDLLPKDESPFEELVFKRLQEDGHIVRRKVGASGVFLDLAIVDPIHPGRYLLGIQCDGASYASSRSARDRDRLKEQVLEAIGWNIYKVWSTDWYRNPEREYARLTEAIGRAKDSTLIADEAEDEILEEESGIVREAEEIRTETMPVYTLAELPTEILYPEFHLHSMGKLTGWMEEVVRVESPVHFDEVARRMVTAAGLSKIGNRIREKLLTALKFSIGSGNIVQKGDFLWYPSMEIPVVRNRAHLLPSSKKMQFISVEEISVGIKEIVKRSIAIPPDEVVPLVARLFGFSRATEEIRLSILKGIEYAVNNNHIVREADLLKVKN